MSFRRQPLARSAKTAEDSVSYPLLPKWHKRHRLTNRPGQTRVRFFTWRGRSGTGSTASQGVVGLRLGIGGRGLAIDPDVEAACVPAHAEEVPCLRGGRVARQGLGRAQEVARHAHPGEHVGVAPDLQGQLEVVVQPDRQVERAGHGRRGRPGRREAPVVPSGTNAGREGRGDDPSRADGAASTPRCERLEAASVARATPIGNDQRHHRGGRVSTGKGHRTSIRSRWKRAETGPSAGTGARLAGAGPSRRGGDSSSNDAAYLPDDPNPEAARRSARNS